MRHKKIPGKKHKGYKDLEAQHAKRNEQISQKINSTPNNPDDQEMPKKLRLLIKAKDSYLEQQKKKKKNNGCMIDQGLINCEDVEDPNLLDSTKHMGYETTLPGMTKPLKPIPLFKQMPGERKKQFFRRMDVTVQAVMKRKQYEEKFDVDVIDDPTTGKTKVQDRVKDEIDMEMEKLKNKKRARKGIVVKTKEEKRKIRREKDKERKRKKKGINKDADDIVDFDNAKFSDRIKFNEVVHAPPENLQKIENYADRKPGKQPNLLIRKLLKTGNDKDNKSKTTSSKKSSVSLARKCMLEEERKRVIEQYRKSKNKRNT